MQSAVLADLLATWIAGHYDVSGKEDHTRLWRESILGMHLNLVRELTPVNEKKLREKQPELFKLIDTKVDDETVQ